MEGDLELAYMAGYSRGKQDGIKIWLAEEAELVAELKVVRRQLADIKIDKDRGVNYESRGLY